MSEFVKEALVAFGSLPDGRAAELFELKNSRGMGVSITNFGGIITSITVPDRRGTMDDVVLGFDTLEPYLSRHPYFGAMVGRYANRIGRGEFTLNGERFVLATNSGANHLHGGHIGFDQALWRADFDGHTVRLCHTSPDGDEGYPGTLEVSVTYTLNTENELRIDSRATADKATPVNLTNHSYFNLAGRQNGDILGHILLLNADRFTPVDAEQIPTGELRSVEGTAMDFRTPVAIGERIDDEDKQLRFGHGYDHNWVLNPADSEPAPAARVVEPSTGRVLEVMTTQPGVQFYTGNFLDGTHTGKAGRVYGRRSGFCLETQHFPDSPNKPQFPSTVLEPGEVYATSTIFRFTVK